MLFVTAHQVGLEFGDKAVETIEEKTHFPFFFLASTLFRPLDYKPPWR